MNSFQSYRSWMQPWCCLYVSSAFSWMWWGGFHVKRLIKDEVLALDAVWDFWFPICESNNWINKTVSRRKLITEPLNLILLIMGACVLSFKSSAPHLALIPALHLAAYIRCSVACLKVGQGWHLAASLILTGTIGVRGPTGSVLSFSEGLSSPIWSWLIHTHHHWSINPL